MAFARPSASIILVKPPRGKNKARGWCPGVLISAWINQVPSSYNPQAIQTLEAALQQCTGLPRGLPRHNCNNKDTNSYAGAHRPSPACGPCLTLPGEGWHIHGPECSPVARGFRGLASFSFHFPLWLVFSLNLSYVRTFANVSALA